jgi:hypothetical protein
MIICMRTTLVLDDGLLRQAKRRAAERDVTLSDVVNEALREALRQPTPTALPYSMITFGRADRPVSHEPTAFSDEQEDQDRDGLG